MMRKSLLFNNILSVKCARKTIVCYYYIIKQPYLETEKSKLVEYTKAYNELTIIKELGKLTT
jgi:hypothetical protein